MPLTAGGTLNVVASADLGGLGAREGVPVPYTWVVPSVAPLLLPWLAILALLALKPNRTAAAWLIWLPLLCVMALSLAPSVLPSGANFFLDVIAALAIGVAAVWLLSDYLRQSHRLLTFGCVLFALAGFSEFAFFSRQGANLLNAETPAIAIALAVGVAVSTVALTLAGWLCRKCYRPIAIYFGLLASLAILWLLVAAPLFFFAVVISGNDIPWSEFFVPVGVVAVCNFAVLLPFLILSSANPLFRARLKALLHVTPAAPPPLFTPAAETNLKI